MPHWLAPIVDLFTCETVDLAELAIMVGYDPANFYRGTLSPADIDRLVLKKDEWSVDDEIFDVDGDLGRAEGILRAPFRLQAIRSAPAAVFANEIALQEAYLAGELDANHFIVLRYSDDQPARFDSVSHLTAVPELLTESGYDTVVLVDAMVSNLSGTMLVVGNFSQSANLGGPIAKIRDGDLISFDTFARKLVIDEEETVLANRRLSRPQQTLRFEFEQRSRDETKALVDLEGFLTSQQAFLVRIVSELEQSRRRGFRSSEPRLRLFRNICAEINGFFLFLNYFDGRQLPQSSAGLLENINDLLGRGSRFAISAKDHRLACLGFEAQLDTLKTIRQGSPNSRSLEFASVWSDLGDAYVAIGEQAEAIRSYESAFEELEIMFGPEMHSPLSAMTFSTAARKLAVQLRRVGQLNKAYDLLRIAKANLVDGGTGILAEQMTVPVYLDLAAVSRAIGRLGEAHDYYEKAIDVLIWLLRRRHTASLMDLLARAYKRRAQLRIAIGSDSEGFGDLLTSLLLRSRAATQNPNRKRFETVVRERRAVVDKAKRTASHLSAGESKLYRRSLEILLEGPQTHYTDIERSLNRLEEELEDRLPRFLFEDFSLMLSESPSQRTESD
jgi:tetratricopeptide (TPR) repeat protein